MKTFIKYILQFACIVATVYAIVMYGPDKSISARYNGHSEEIIQLREHLSQMRLELNEVHIKDELIQAKCDSVIKIETDKRTKLIVKLDSLSKAKDPHYIKRIPAKLLK
jgi:hypothetical protein